VELLKKTILRAMTTGLTATTTGYSYIIIPDIDAVYHFKIGLTAELQDIGFFDAHVAPVVPESPPLPPPENTYYYVDNDDTVFIDSDGKYFVWTK